MNIRQQLRRWHIWLGWVVALPFLVWTVSGVVMVARPIEEVRGTNLIAPPPILPTGLVPVPPAIGPRPVASLRLEQRSAGPRWVVAYADGEMRLADPASGRLQPALTAAEAAREALSLYTGKATQSGVDRISKDAPPLDFRRPIDAWRVTMSDGTRFYVHAGTGEILARRTRWWRFYDLMWGLHIMDPGGREDTHNPWVVGFGIAGLLTVLMALVMLPLTIRRNGARGRRAQAARKV